MRKILERALDDVRKEQEAYKRCRDKAIAQDTHKATKVLKKAQREAERAARKSRKQAELEINAQNQRLRGRPNKNKNPKCL